ncbi:MAG: ketoacyl-ACP synthase III [Bacteroidota bacterium]|nr:ketoacyl-ACP synthase III [Bacteroidota bacterium]
MSKRIYTVVKGTGSCIPDLVVKNDHFLTYNFFDPATRKAFERSNEDIIKKFREITNIEERRWAREDQMTSDLAVIAAEEALQAAGVDRESIDFIIVGHNFGDVKKGCNRVQTLPSVSNRVKAKLGIHNPMSITHDVINGCPSWVTALVVADAYIRTGDYKRGLVIGADVNSRVSDPHDRDTMIFSDGAGAVLVEGVESETPVGILSHVGRSDSLPYQEMLKLDKSYNDEYERKEDLFIRMQGHKLYVYALSTVPSVVKESLDKAGLDIQHVNKVLIHQANEKMDEAILERLFKLYKVKGDVKAIMPMSIKALGNTSSATIPTLWNLVLKGKIEGHEIKSGDNLVICSVGGGMNINSVIYRVP